MYRQVGGSALLFIALGALFSNVGGVGHLTGSGTGKSEISSQTAKSSDTDKTLSALEMDTHKCSAVEVLRRHLGDPEQGSGDIPQAGSASNLVCSEDAFKTLPALAAGNGPTSPANHDAGSDPIHPLTLSCSHTAGNSHDAGSCKVLIATVPDPLQSANALEFDRDMQALQEAVSTAGYDFESIYTPWDLSELEEPKDAKSGHEAQHYRRLFGDQPGAMLFHRRPHPSTEGEAPDSKVFPPGSELLLLLLVPESPTYGLNMHAAREALSAIDQLKSLYKFSTDFSKRPDDGISWIGPNYSSSVPGLKQLDDGSQHFHAFSGSVTSGPAIDLLRTIDKIDRAGSDEEVTAAASDKAALDHLLSSGVIAKGKYNSIDLLLENESAYGAGDPYGAQHSGLRAFRFPRGISHVRGIFGKQLTNFKPQSSDTPTAQDTKSLFDFTDTLQQPLDTAPEFAAQSPFSNEGVLAAIASSMEHEHASAIIIFATDPLDQLFLARYFHQKVPDARLVLFTAERLLPGLRGQYDLDGTLTVTHFPLFEDSFLQTPMAGEARHSLTFMNSTQEGLFLAALHQIAPHHIFESSGSDKLEQVPIWISISSNGGFWPIERTASKPPNTKNTLDDSYVITDVPEESLPKLWLISTSLVLLCTAIHIAFFFMAGPLHDWMCRSDRPWVKTMASHRALTFYLASRPDASDPTQWKREFGRQYWLVGATAQLILVLSWLLLPAIVFVSGHKGASVVSLKLAAFIGKTDGLTSIFGLAAVVIWLAAWVPFVVLTVSVAKLGLDKSRPKTTSHYLLGPVILLVWFAFNLAVLKLKLGDPTSGWLFSIRCVHLASGVCPVLPLLLASLGFITAAAVNLNALTLARDRDPQMPQLPPDLRIGPVALDICHGQLTTFIECWGVLPPPYGPILSLCVVFACAVLHPLRAFGSIDGEWMTWLYTLTFVLAFWTIAWLWVRFVSIWKLLRFLLELLEGSPLRFAFSRLPRVFSLAPIWSYAGLRRTLILPMRWFEYRRVTPNFDPTDEHQQHLIMGGDLLNDIITYLGNDQVLIDRAYIKFSADQNRYATFLAGQRFVRTSWAHGGPDVESASLGNGGCGHSGKDDPGKKEAKAIPVCREDVPLPCDTVVGDPCKVAIANEYIAMRFGAYVRYVMLQLKNLMTFMSMGLLFLLLAAVSYPFRQPQSIAWSVVAIVAVLLFGVGTVLVQMDRDSILSRMSETTPGEVDRGAFMRHMLSVGGLPVLAALAALFPSIGNFLFSWLQPMLTTLH